jgi:hypothetical protein
MNFNRMFHVVVSYLHTRCILIHSYVDDSILKSFSAQLLERHTRIVREPLLQLGFMVSCKKSEIIPRQWLVFREEHFRTDIGLV